MRTHNAAAAVVLVVAMTLAAASDAAWGKGGRGGGHGSRGSSGSGTAHVSGATHTHAISSSHRTRGSRSSFGFFFFGGPLFASSYPVYYPAYPPNYGLALASQYIEKDPEPRSPSDYWYYCPGSKTYYPYVSECPEGWQAVEPVPPA